jgi:hypothetical protein
VTREETASATWGEAPTPDVYTLEASLAKSSLPLNAENTLTVTTRKNEQPIIATVNVSEVFLSGKISHSVSLTTDSSGQAQTTLVMGIAGNAAAIVTWKAPDGKTYSQTVNATWGGTASVGEPEFQVVIKAGFNAQQVQDIAGILKRDHHWVPKIEEVTP